ncbi:MAG TPA: DUF4241 domain-containing protein, partial [Cytophagales bacterium]|nr:DUF4241 domain-containing protein [Cytophagales bacterium]
CFLDAQTNRIYLDAIEEFYIKHPDQSYYEDVLAPEFAQYSSDHAYSRDLGDWNNHNPRRDSMGNVIMFAAGWGDGYYPCYWGLNTEKQIVELTVDLMLDFENETE